MNFVKEDLRRMSIRNAGTDLSLGSVPNAEKIRDVFERLLKEGISEGDLYARISEYLDERMRSAAEDEIRGIANGL